MSIYVIPAWSVYVDYRGPLISTNQSYKRTRTGILYKSTEAKTVQAAMALAAKRAMRDRIMLEGPIEILLDYWFANRRPDLDGCIKPTLDSLEGVVYQNDRQVVRLSVAKHVADFPKEVGFALTAHSVKESNLIRASLNGDT